jgi:polyisoprenoid-binding protein YceI
VLDIKRTQVRILDREEHRSMSVSTVAPVVPAGTWGIDPTHSTVGFAVRHMVVATFRSTFKAFDATLVADESGARLTGTVQAASIDIADPNFKAHLDSPEFFDVAQHPTLTFVSSTLRRDGDRLEVEGDLTIRGITHRVVGTGSVTEPTEDPYGRTRVGLTVQATVDRTAYGLNWNAPLPKGGVALANEVTIDLDLELIQA